MILMLILGGIMGLIIHSYLSCFADNLSAQIYQTYCQIFPQNAPHFMPNSSLNALKCGQKWQYFILFAVFFAFCAIGFEDISLALLFSLYLSSLFVISMIDWHYQLISPTLCQLLWLLGVLSAVQFDFISLEQSLLSSACGFFSFFVLYYAAKFYYGQEALGRGDYWLVGALSSFMPYQQIPLFIFIACLLALSYVLLQYARKQRIHMLPFAPFLHFSGFILLSIAEK